MVPHVPLSTDKIQVHVYYARHGPMKRSDPKAPWKPLMIRAEGEKVKTAERGTGILSKFKQKKTSKTILSGSGSCNFDLRKDQLFCWNVTTF